MMYFLIIAIFLSLQSGDCVSQRAILLCTSSQNICKNNATCLVIDGVTSCQCPPNFTGALCEVSLLATTTKSPSSITLCPSTITTCKNGGTCLLLNGTTVICKCSVDFTGPYCETSLASTTPPAVALCPSGTTICKNGGSCFILNGVSIICKCPSNFTGQYCETSLIASTTTSTSPPAVALCPIGSSLCQNGGSCFILSGVSTICKCTPNFSGTYCEIPLAASTVSTTLTTTAAPLALCPATSNICQNGGACFIQNGATIICKCQPNFTGAFCETPLLTTTTTTTVAAVALCPTTPIVCKNGGTCFILNGSTIKCQCPPNYTGTYCDILVTTTATTITTTRVASTQVNDPCASLTCKYGGQKIVDPSGVCKCKCLDNFYGFDCGQFNITVLPTLNDPVECNLIPCDNIPESEITGLCPLKCLFCSSTLNGKSCENAGILKSTCKCECLNNYSGDYCEIEPQICPADGNFCGSQFTVANCADEFVRSICPNMCNAC